MDHRVPLTAGGKDELANCRILCKRCHRAETNRYRESRLAQVTRTGRLKPADGWVNNNKNKKKTMGRSRYASRSKGW